MRHLNRILFFPILLTCLWLFNGCSDKTDSTSFSAPTNLRVSVSGDNIILSWNSVPNAREYKVYFSEDSSNGPWSLLITTTYTSIEIPTGGSAGTVCFVVTAVNNNSEETSYSSPVLFAVQGGGSGSGAETVPSAPTGVSISNSGTSSSPNLLISWNTSSGATGYRVYRSSSSSSGYSSVGTTSSTSYRVGTPSSGYNYYKVTAYNSAGESGLSSYVSYNYTVESAPSTPSVSVSGSSSSLTITWSCSSGNPSKYTVYKRNPNTGDYSELTTTTNQRYTDYNVHPGYNRYAVKAINNTGSSTGYGMSSSISLSRPTSFSASASGGYISCSWSTVSAASGYQIFQSSSSYGTYYIMQQVNGGSTKSCSIYYPASSGTTVYLKIRAIYEASYAGDPIYSDYSSYTSVRF